ncbi:MAG: bifunctional oligoribonuclease/PAP phosphatase NrnA [Spirochaetales bacterium]|nr:bifunctional oligoribonuclease/PAP phosphatase NrnA [Spirochaetales bacterium]
MEFQNALNFISKYEKFIICAHESPDGDAVGSEFALLQGLKHLKKEAIILNNDPTPENFTFIDTTNEIGYFDEDTQLPKDIDQYGLFILDTNDTANIGEISEILLPKVKEYFIIDHHEDDSDQVKDNLIYKDASSTAEIIYLLLKELKVKITSEIADALYMAIVYDTGSFIYPKTTARTFEIACDLVSKGVIPNRIYSKVYETDSISSIKLMSQVLSTLEMEFNNQVAIQLMSKEMLKKTGGKYEESRAFINIPLKAAAIKISVFFKEDEKGVFRCSLRSKGSYDVCAIARHFGGGGHKTAAGFKCTEPLDKIKPKLLAKLKKEF